MSSIFASVLRNRPVVLARLALLLVLPWAWVAFVVPMPSWVLGACGGMSALLFAVAVRWFVTPTFARRRSDDRNLSAAQLANLPRTNPAHPPLALPTST